MKNLREALVNKNSIKHIKIYSDRYIVDPWLEYEDYAEEHYKNKTLENLRIYILTHSEIASLIKNTIIKFNSNVETYLEIWDFNDNDDILHVIENSDLVWDDIVDKFKLKKVSPKKFM